MCHMHPRKFHPTHTHSSTTRREHTAAHTARTAQHAFSSNNPDFEILKNFQVFVYRASVGNTKINFILFFEHEFSGTWTFNSENENDERNLPSFLPSSLYYAVD